MKIQFLAILTLFGLSACAMPSLDALTGADKPTTMASATASGIKGAPMRMDAIAYAERNGIPYQVAVEQKSAIKTQTYSDNFRYGRTQSWTH